MNNDTWLPRLKAKLRDAKHQAERKQVRSVLDVPRYMNGYDASRKAPPSSTYLLADRSCSNWDLESKVGHGTRGRSMFTH